MDQRTVQFLDRVLKDHAAWLKQGASWPGLYPGTSPIHSAGRPVAHQTPGKRHRAANGDKPLLPPHQPKETRKRPESRPLTAKTSPLLERVNSVILKLPEETKHVWASIYLYQMEFKAISRVLDIPSYKIGKHRHSVIKAVSVVM